MTKPQLDKRTQKVSFVPKRIADEDDETRSLRPSILFLGLALCLTLGIAVWLGLVETNDEIRLEISDISSSSNGNIALTGARYRGHTETGKRFEVIATAAVEHALVGTITSADGTRGFMAHRSHLAHALALLGDAKEAAEVDEDLVVEERDAGALAHLDARAEHLADAVRAADPAPAPLVPRRARAQLCALRNHRLPVAG